MVWLTVMFHAAIAVIGGGIDLACACDVRYCSADAFFSIAEVKVGLAADLGKLLFSILIYVRGLDLYVC